MCQDLGSRLGAVGLTCFRRYRRLARRLVSLPGRVGWRALRERRIRGRKKSSWHFTMFAARAKLLVGRHWEERRGDQTRLDIRYADSGFSQIGT